MKNDRTLAVVALVAVGGYLLYRRSQGLSLLPDFGGGLGTIAGQGDPRFQRNLVGIQGTGNTNPIAAALTGLAGSVAKLFGSAVGGAPARNAPPTNAGNGALNAGGTYTTGLPPGGDRTHDPFAGFDQLELWSPGSALAWEQNMNAGLQSQPYAYVLPGDLPAGYDDFAGLER